jgi:hypothetical protein
LISDGELCGRLARTGAHSRQRLPLRPTRRTRAASLQPVRKEVAGEDCAGNGLGGGCADHQGGHVFVIRARAAREGRGGKDYLPADPDGDTLGEEAQDG